MQALAVPQEMTSTHLGVSLPCLWRTHRTHLLCLEARGEAPLPQPHSPVTGGPVALGPPRAARAGLGRPCELPFLFRRLHVWALRLRPTMR